VYTKTVPFKDFKGKPRNEVVHFNLSEREVFKLLPELQAVFHWMDSNKEADPRELGVDEVRDFYNEFEAILLEAWGIPSEDGQHFRKSERYDFEESALFNATMVMFVTEPQETAKLLEGIIPEGLSEMIKTAAVEDVADVTSARAVDQSDEIAELRRRLASAESDKTTE
jgi:hypothetical protein